MNDSTGFLMYAALYRLTVLAVGALSIWLGFRLFSAAGSKGKTVDNAGSASAEGGGFKLTLTSILPGTYFALFGTVIIGIMLWKGEPPQWNEKNAVTLPGVNASPHFLLLSGMLRCACVSGMFFSCCALCHVSAEKTTDFLTAFSCSRRQMR